MNKNGNQAQLRTPLQPPVLRPPGAHHRHHDPMRRDPQFEWLRFHPRHKWPATRGPRKGKALIPRSSALRPHGLRRMEPVHEALTGRGSCPFVETLGLSGPKAIKPWEETRRGWPFAPSGGRWRSPCGPPSRSGTSDAARSCARGRRRQGPLDGRHTSMPAR